MSDCFFRVKLARIYTHSFAKSVVDILPLLKDTTVLHDGDAEYDGLKLFAETTYSDNWEDAKLRPFIHYLYGANGLRIPDC